MQEKRFERDEAEEIIRHCDSQLTDFIRVDDRGVWPAVDRDGLAKAEYEALAWRPALASKNPLLNVREIPALPFPFSAGQLAAFMMGGAGSMVQDFYGEWEDGPDVDCLEIIPEEFNFVRIALTDAFQAYRDALEIVGSYPLELQERADRLRKIYNYRNRKANTRESVSARDMPGDEEAQRIEVNARRERAIASNSGWSKLYEVAAKECHAAAVDWRAAMVNTLLEPARAPGAATPAPVAASDWPAIASERSDAMPSSEVSETVATVNDGPTPLTTGDVAHCFAGLHWNELQWKKPLGDKPKWLDCCVAIPGRRGVSETRWNPVSIGAALVRQGHATNRNVRAKFQSNHLLMPWLDSWKTYEADYLDIE